MAEHFNELIHQRVRLQIMAMLTAVDASSEVDFTFLRKQLGVTDGNLGAHLQKLEEAGYVQMHRTAVGKRPKTYLSVTQTGREVYQLHVQTLQQWLHSNPT